MAETLEPQVDQVPETSQPTPVPDDPDLQAINECLAAAAFSLKFDIAELWQFASDTNTGRGSSVSGQSAHRAAWAAGTGGMKPYCEHVYTMPATLKTYTGRIAGIWKSGFDDSRSPGYHVLSPSMCEQAKASECPLWFTSTPSRKLHPSLPINTAVALPVHIDTDSDDEGAGKLYVAVFLSLTLHERNVTALEFLTHVSKAATSLLLERKAKSLPPKAALERAQEDEAKKEEHLQDVPVLAHAGGQVNIDVDWSELADLMFLVSGNRCNVYTATYKEQPVVVKVIRKGVQHAEAVKNELELELALLQRIRHEYIVKLVGAGTYPERFLVFGRLDGGTLAQRCDRTTKLRDRRSRFQGKKVFSHIELLRCGRQIAEALRYLHEEAVPGKMVVHRDVKPDNIGFSAEGEAKLLDLGLSRVVSKSEMDNARYSMTGDVGSARYMAPEVAESRPYNEKVDVYSYGMVLWEMTTLKKPFDGMRRDKFFAQVIRGSLRPAINKKWPKPWADLMQACWAEDPNKRPSFANVGDLLQGMLQDGIHQHCTLPAVIENSYEEA